MTVAQASRVRPATGAAREVRRPRGAAALPPALDATPPAQALRCKSRRLAAGTSVTVEVAGELDGWLVGELRESLLGAAATRPGEIVVDLSRVSFLDTAALRTLIAARRRCVAAETRFALRRPSRAVETLLALTHLDQVFAVERAGDPAGRR